MQQLFDTLPLPPWPLPTSTLQRMRQGPKRDRAMIEKKTQELFNARLADWNSDEDSESQAKLSITPVQGGSTGQ